jgi:hypothetical protein
MTIPVFWHSNCSLTHSSFDPLQDKSYKTQLGLFFHWDYPTASKGLRKMVLRKVAILSTLFIFAMICRAWCDAVKSINGAAIQLMTMKMDKNRALMQKKTVPLNELTEWLKKSQENFRDLGFLKTPDEKKRLQWVESLDKGIYSREFSENDWRNKFSSPGEARETKSPSSNSGRFVSKESPDENGHIEERKILTTLRLLQSREDLLKEIFVGFRFSFDLANGRVHLEMNVTPSSEKRSGFIVRF